MYVSLQNLHSFEIGVDMEVLPLSELCRVVYTKKDLLEWLPLFPGNI